ncbi:transmembrane protein, putative (macronuclear) [Tetrahymena thermophila SB210]|uniref:Transmembrane protein, putative n=1 Tax=Tetrahymena thermophila (strain SB210) TaxID=312017 RepID=Q22U88_TETTS|nr:transmembrane protein, putative [Tetrahymena thermophila SB210]EAR88799.1 transmembrane protein, putative [Tetrahymena thermophila SB210]|eukprot:XP_001009044.1 transmembrane protein, putative [Tetrahymena thermophila SB210]
MNNKLQFIIVVIGLSYLVNFLGVFQHQQEFIANYTDCKYLEADIQLYGTEDSVVYNQDIIIGIHTSIHKVFTTNIDVDQLEKGGFFAIYGISKGNLLARKVKVLNYPENLLFNPHGIEIREEFLYVINHSFYTGGERVETYKISLDEEGLVVLNYLHATHMNSKLNGTTNDILFLSETRFIITQWLIFPIPLKGNGDQSLIYTLTAMISQLLNLKFTYAYNCNYVQSGEAVCHKIESSLGVAVNGIAFDGKDTIAISDTVGRSLKIYKLNEKYELELQQTLQTNLMIDNINYDKQTQQFIASGSNTVYEYLLFNNKLERVLKNKSNKSSIKYSAVVQAFKYNQFNKLFEPELIFQSSHSVATISGALFDHSQKYLFLNNFSDKSIVVCEKNVQKK